MFLKAGGFLLNWGTQEPYISILNCYYEQVLAVAMSQRENEDHFDKYAKYAKNSRGVPEEFDDWVLDNNIKLPPKKKISKEEEIDDTWS